MLRHLLSISFFLYLSTLLWSNDALDWCLRKWFFKNLSENSTRKYFSWKQSLENNENRVQRLWKLNVNWNTMQFQVTSDNMLAIGYFPFLYLLNFVAGKQLALNMFVCIDLTWCAIDQRRTRLMQWKKVVSNFHLKSCSRPNFSSA